MTDSQDKPTTAPRIGPETGLPMFAAWVEMWMAPITITARMMGMGPTALPDEPEIDRGKKDAQLPVPNPHQKAKDKDLFA